ncbi:MAG: hypothetical protein COC01_07325 [Bacteroidetes bacterium]|nr:MAG: hypothetical protein COC01_07325 [Bacteroidota bacterium]
MKNSIIKATVLLLLITPFIVVGQVRFLWVNPGTDEIAIKNFGGSSFDISTYKFCSKFAYTGNLSTSVTVLSGSLNIGAGDTVVVNGFAINNTAADLGLYSSSSFASTSAMVDFTQWGSGGNGRESVAVSKGIWSTGDFVSGTAPYSYTGNGSDNGVTFWKSFTIPPCNTFNLTSSTTDATCNAGSDGSADVAVTGGTAPYTFAWTNGSTDSINANLVAANYTVTITDNDGCDTTATIIINEPNAITVTAVQQIDASCGNSDGIIAISAAGGTGVFTYSWDSGQNDSVITGLSAGSYELTVTDGANCTWINSYNISDAGAPTISIVSKTNVSCAGGNDGWISVSVNGGVAPYTYLWSTTPIQTDSLATSLSADIYNVEVTDSVGCKALTNITITEPSQLSVSISNKSNVSCYGDSDGLIDITITGGTGSYTYSWSNSLTTEDITSLTDGDYSIFVTDENGCVDSTSRGISQPDSLMLFLTTTSEITGGDGTANVSTSGGTTPYMYKWSINFCGTNPTGLDAGVYTVTVVDANGCEKFKSDSVKRFVGLTDYQNEYINYRIYPNPVQEKLYLDINLTSPDDIVITFHDIRGRVVFRVKEESIKEKEFEFDLQKYHCLPGSYIISVQTNNQTLVKKVLLN